MQVNVHVIVINAASNIKTCYANVILGSNNYFFITQQGTVNFDEYVTMMLSLYEEGPQKLNQKETIHVHRCVDVTAIQTVIVGFLPVNTPNSKTSSPNNSGNLLSIKS